MPQFTDATGATWKIPTIDVAMLDDLQAAGLNVEEVAEDLTRLGALFEKPRVFAAVLWVFVGTQVTEAGLTPIEFKRRLNGDVIYSAGQAIQEAIIGFFPYPRAVKDRLLANMRATKEAEVKKILDRLDNPAGSAS